MQGAGLMVRRGFLILGLLLIAASLPASDASVATLNDTGLEKLEAGDYEGATHAFMTARQLNPDHEVLISNHAMALNAWAVNLGREGRHGQAVERLEQALELAPGNPAIRANLSAIRASWGIELMKAGDFTDAETQLFAAYETVAPDREARIDSLRAHNFALEARAWRERGEPDRAIHYYEKSLRVDPGNIVSLIELGQLHDENGDSELALNVWQRARDLDADVEGLDERIEKLKRELAAEDGFETKERKIFRVSYHGEANEDAARTAMAIVNDAYRRIGKELDHHPERRIHVILYTREQFADVTLVPHWSGAVYDGKIRIPISDGRLNGTQQARLEETIYHEYTHAIVHDVAGGRVASWFNEGLATYFELERRPRMQRYEREHQTLARLYRNGGLPSVLDLPEVFVSIEDPREAQLAYQIARTFMAWLARKEGERKFGSVLKEMAKGLTLEAAFEAIYNRSVPEMEAEWYRSLDR